MSTKIIFIAILGFCLLQALDSAAVSNTKASEDAKSIIGGIIDEARKIAEYILKNIIQTLKEAVEKALADMNDIEPQVRAKGEEMEALKQAALKKVEEDVAQEIEKFTLNAAEAGVDIAVCIVDQQTQVARLVQETISELGSCVTDEIALGEERAKALLVVIKDALQFSEDITEALTSCFNSVDPFRVLDCVIDTASTAEKGVVEIAKNLKNEVEAVAKFILHVVPDLAQCADAKVKRAEEQVQGILQQISQCVEDKLQAAGTKTH